MLMLIYIWYWPIDVIIKLKFLRSPQTRHATRVCIRQRIQKTAFPFLAPPSLHTYIHTYTYLYIVFQVANKLKTVKEFFFRLKLRREPNKFANISSVLHQHTHLRIEQNQKLNRQRNHPILFFFYFVYILYSTVWYAMRENSSSSTSKESRPKYTHYTHVFFIWIFHT